MRPSSLLPAYAAASLSSAVLCPLPDTLPPKTLETCLERVSARLPIARDGAPIEDLCGAVPKDWDADAVASDPLAILFAGLDGPAPRAAVHNAHTLLAGNDWASARFGLSPADRIAVAVPDPAWAIVAVNLALASGAALCEAGATVAVGGALPGARLTLAADTGCRIWIAPETQLALAAATDAPEALMPAPGVSLRLVDRDGKILAGEGEGALELRGPNLAPSYLDDEEANRNRFTGEGWWRTGLRARIDAAGAVALLGNA